MLISKQLVYADKLSQLKNFSAIVDNITTVNDVFNLAVVPVFGYQSNELVGVLQFVNKQDRVISEYDVHQMKIIASLLGRGIQNATEHHAAMAVKVSVQNLIHDIKDAIQ